MSYILEALKKSQRDRETGKVPDLTTETPTDSLDPRPGISLWVIGAVVIALLALLVALYGVFGRQLNAPETSRLPAQDPVLEQPPPVAPEAPKAQNQANVSARREATPPARVTPKPAPVAAVMSEPVSRVAAVEKKTDRPAPVKEPAVAPSSGQPAARQSELEKIRQEYAHMQAQEKQLAQDKKPPTTSQQASVEPAAVDISTTKPAAPVTAEHPFFHELPTDVQARIPPRNIMLQSYSEGPEQRFVILNSVKLHQGQSTTDGLQVLEIRVDGILFGFESYKFFQPR